MSPTPEPSCNLFITVIRTYGDSECELTFRCPGTIIYLRWLPANLKASEAVLDRYYRNLAVVREDQDKYDENNKPDQAGEDGNDDYNDDDDDETLAKVAQAEQEFQAPFVPLMYEMALTAEPLKRLTLHDWLHPKCFFLHAVADADGSVKAERIYQDDDSPTEERPWAIPEDHQLETWVPKWYSSTDVHLASDTNYLEMLTEVFDENKKPYLFKKYFDEGSTGSQELGKLRQIDDAVKKGILPPDCRIFRLEGVVRDTDIRSRAGTSQVVGILLSHIKSKHPGFQGMLLHCAGNASSSLRRRWAADLERTVEQLHGAGLTWGAVSARNVLVDTDDALWITEFGTGSDVGWVRRSKWDTVEGDLDGLRKMREFLESPFQED